MHAQALWDTRPPNVVVNTTANHELWSDRETEDLLTVAATVRCPFLMLFGAEDPRPWSASDALFDALPNAHRLVLQGAGHPPWAEQSAATRHAILDNWLTTSRPQ